MADQEFMQSATFTTDMWTNHTNRAFISLTIHYIDKNFKLQNWTIECREFHGAHAGEAIRVKLDDVISKLDLPESCHIQPPMPWPSALGD